MTTPTYAGPSRAELELLLRAAAMSSPREHGREQARRRTTSLLTGLSTVATAVAVYDVGLVVGAL